MVRGEAAILKRVSILVVALLAVLLLAPLFPSPTSAAQFRLLAYSTHAVWFLLLALLLSELSPLARLPIRRLLALLLAAFVLVMIGNVASLGVATDIAKIGFGALAGIAFVRAIERPWWLVPIAMCVPIADAWSVFNKRGVTKAIIERAQEQPAWIDWPTLATPIAGFPYEDFGRLGIVDVLFLALFLVAAARFGMGVWRGIIACSLGLLTTSVLVFEGATIAVPALPLLCLAFLIVYAPALWRDLRDDLRPSRT